MKQRALLFAAITIICAAGWHIWRADPRENAPIRIGINPWMGYEFFYLAEQKGFLAGEGLNVRLLQYASLEDVRAAFERQHVDGMTSTVVEVIQAGALGNHRAQVVLVVDFSNGADVILAKHPHASMSALKGKKIGVEKVSLGMFMLARALEKAGMTLSDVQALAYDQPAMKRALEENKIDAAVTYPPFSVEISRQGDMRRVFDSTAIPGEILDTLSLDSEFLKRKPETAAALVRAWGKAVAYAQEHPDEAYAIMAKRENISTGEFAEGLKQVHIVAVEEQAELMKPGGKLEQAIVMMSDILHRADEMKHPVTAPEHYVFRGKP